MALRTVIALLVGLLPAASAAEPEPLASSAPSTGSPSLTCPVTDDIEPLLVPGHVLLLGELHGTREAAEFVARVTCQALARGLHVTVALELPTREEEAVRDPQAPIVELPFWAKDYQDGRVWRCSS